MMQAKYRHAEKLKTLRLLLFDDNATNPFERHKRRGIPLPPPPNFPTHLNPAVVVFEYLLRELSFCRLI